MTSAARDSLHDTDAPPLVPIELPVAVLPATPLAPPAAPEPVRPQDVHPPLAPHPQPRPLSAADGPASSRESAPHRELSAGWIATAVVWGLLALVLLVALLLALT